VLVQVKLNMLLLECLSAAGHWQDARQHAEAFHRSLPLSKHKGLTAAAALEALAAWRATCVVKAGPGRAMEDMPRLLSELSTAQAKVGACLFVYCCMACAVTCIVLYIGTVPGWSHGLVASIVFQLASFPLHATLAWGCTN
jgi:hypothetical protein